MKYHSSRSTILISLSIVALFILVSCAIIFTLDMTSPTLLFTQNLFKELSEAETDITFSFSSIERSVRDQINFHDLAISYKGEQIVHFDRINFDMGLFPLFAYLVSGDGMLTINAEGGYVDIPDYLLSTEDLVNLETTINNNEEGNDTLSLFNILDKIKGIREEELNIRLPKWLNRFGINLKSADLNVRAGELINMERVDMNIYFDHGLEGLSFMLSTPRLSSSFGVYEATVNDIRLASNSEKGNLNTKLTIGDVAIEEDNSTLLSLASLELSLAPSYSLNMAVKDIPINFTVGELQVNKDKINGNIQRISFDSSSICSLGLYNGELTYNNINLDFGSILLSDSPNWDKLTLTISALDINSGELSYLASDEIAIELLLNERSIKVSVPKLNSTFKLDGNDFDSLSLSSVKIESDVNDDDELNVAVATSLSINSQDSFLSGIKSKLDLSFILSRGRIASYILSLSSLELPSASSPFSLLIVGNSEGAELKLIHDSSILGEISLSKGILGSIKFDSFSLSEIKPYIVRYLPQFGEYIGDNTTLNGSITLNLAKDREARLGYDGKATVKASINGVRFNQYSFDLDTLFNVELNRNELSLNNTKITLPWFYVTFDGSLDLNSLLPYGHLVINREKGESPILELNLDLQNNKYYDFSTIFPILEDTYIKGFIDFREENKINSEAEISVLSRKYPLNISIDLENFEFFASNSNLDLNVSWRDRLNIDLILSSFILSRPSDETKVTISGNSSFSFDFAKQLFDIKIEDFSISDIPLFPGSPAIAFSFTGNNKRLDVKDILVTAHEMKPLTGSAEYVFDPSALSLYISDGEEEEYMASLIKDQDSYIGILRGNEMNMGRFGIPMMVGQINLNGKGSTFDDFSLSGSLYATEDKKTGEAKELKATIYIDSDEFLINDLSSKNDSYEITVSSLALKTKAGEMNIDDLYYRLSIPRIPESFIISSSLDMKIEFEESDNLLSLAKNLFDSRANGIKAFVDVDNINLNSEVRMNKRSFSTLYSNKRIDFNGELADGFIDLKERRLDLTLDSYPITKFKVSGDFSDSEEKFFTINIDSIAVNLINASFARPFMSFTKTSYLYGDLNLAIKDGRKELYGQLQADYAEFDVFWLPNQRIILHNPTFLVWDNEISSVLCNATVMDLTTYKRTPTRLSLGLFFDNNLYFDSWTLDVYLKDGDEIPFRLPVLSSNIDITGRVSGYYRIEATLTSIKNFGTVTVDDAVLSIGMAPLPSWFVETGMETEIDFDLLLRKNPQFIYPLGANPILRANIAENQRIKYRLSPKSGISVEGDLALKSGEIFYFQKNFYITEGSVRLRDGMDGIDPIINLRARLRDFDSDGEKVDIYLVLREATLDNFSPQFESSPAKDLNEIMSILGQSILPTTTAGNDSYINAFVSLAASSIDILSRTGIIGKQSNDARLNNSIMSGLSLDTFSLHTNILANLLTDTVSLAGFTKSSAVSPMARYLDGTTLYMGKYFTPNLYMQVMFHLASSSGRGNTNGFSFIADDLMLDTELSLEWSNPLCTAIFFTQPVNFTAYSMFESFGFTLMKRLVF